MRSMMHSTLAAQSDATIELVHSTNLIEPCRVRTPQRNALYHDKHRVKLKDAKKWALVASGCFSTKEVKYWLKKLKVGLNLRMTSAWVAIWKELAPSIKSAKQIETTVVPMSATSKFKVGDRAQLIYNSDFPLIESQGGIHTIYAIDGDRVQLAYFAPWVPQNQLDLVMEF